MQSDDLTSVIRNVDNISLSEFKLREQANLRCVIHIRMNVLFQCFISYISKIFEKLLILQLKMYFDDIFSQYLSGYRTSYGCQDVLLHFINIFKKALDDGNVCMALLTDL